MDVGYAIHHRIAGLSGWEAGMSVQEAVADVKRLHDETRRIVEAQGLAPTVAEPVFRIAFFEATKQKHSDVNQIVQNQVAKYDDDKDAALGILRQAVWDVESTAHAPLGELKFTPYPIKKEVLEWLDKDGDLVGFELQDNRMYYIQFGKRYDRDEHGWMHVIDYQCPHPHLGEDWYQSQLVRQEYGGEYNSITPEMVPKVQAMWETAQKYL